MGKKKDKRERKERALEEREWELEERERLARDREALDRAAAAAAQPLPGLERLAPDPAVEIAGLRRRSPRVLAARAPGAEPLGPGAALAREVVSRLAGVRLVYGEPVTVDGHTVIPVARVKVRGGMGFGNGAESGEGSGGGGGGLLDAAPMGFIDVTATGSTYTPIALPARRGASAAGVALLGVAAGFAGAALRARRAAPTGRRRIARLRGR